MRIKTTSLVGGTALAVLALVASSAVAKGPGSGRAKGKPQRATSDLASVDPAVDLDARGRIDIKHFPAVGKRAERSWMRVKLGRLDGTDYTLWMDDPATPETDLVQVTAFTANDDGAARVRFDTKHAETLPHGATLAALGGMALEVRDSGGMTVMTGSVPVFPQ